MPTYGIGVTGFYSKPLSVIDDEIDEGLRGILGESAGTDADGKIPTQSFAGQLKALLVDGFAAHWDRDQAIIANLDPSKAGGVFQDIICSLTGTERNRQRQSVATGTCIGDPGTSLPAGRVATVEGTGSRFATATGVAIASGVAWSASGAYLIGDLRHNVGRMYQCIATGIAGASGPFGTSADITDNQVHWKHLGVGTGLVHALFRAEQFGALGAATGALNAIATPVDGWRVVNNLVAGVAGRATEKDSALRVRRDQELAIAGKTTVDGIRADILNVNEGSTDPNHEPPTSCSVFFNDTDYTDANGLPPHSVEVLVYGGTTADIAQAIWDSVGGGTATYGSRSDPVIDSEGNTQTVRWSRPTEIGIYVTATGRYDASVWPASSETVVAQYMRSALLTATADWPPALDVRTSPLNAAFMRGPAGATGGVALIPADENADPVPGLLEVTPLYIGTSGASGTSTIVIGRREIAVFDGARVTITASSDTP